MLLSALATRLGKEQRMIARRLTMVPRAANDSGPPAMAFRTAIR